MGEGRRGEERRGEERREGVRAIRKEKMSNKSPDIGSHFTRRRPFLTGNIGHYEIERGGESGDLVEGRRRERG